MYNYFRGLRKVYAWILEENMTCENKKRLFLSEQPLIWVVMRLSYQRPLLVSGVIGCQSPFPDAPLCPRLVQVDSIRH